MSTISNTADFLRLLREDPDFRDEARRLLLTQELIELPERFARFEAYMERRLTEMQGDITEMQGDITEIKGDITKMQGDITPGETSPKPGETSPKLRAIWEG